MLICPTGTLREILSITSAQNIPLPFFRNMWFPLRIPSRCKGVTARSSRNVGRGAVDATMSCAHEVAGRAQVVSDQARRARRAAWLRTAKACGPGTRCWCQVSRRRTQPNRDVRCQAIRETTVAKGIRHRGERVISRKTIAWGMPDVSGASAVNTRVHNLLPIAHTRLRVHWAPGIPRALSLQRADELSKPRAHRVASAISFRLFDSAV
jgi:hypothetical protein